jgi:eukaryotic-like serine/threonine-protein kinase
MMGLPTGTKLGRYEIRSKLGAGGMGEVYLARDLKLGREVAIKAMPDTFSLDTDRLARFEREARLLASLNHPHIGAIYGLEECGDNRFLILELVSGIMLTELIARGPVPIEEALQIARQIAVALEVAHERGIVHRDLNPSNIKITDDDQVKVLDFGLAKALEEPTDNSRISESPTVLFQGTQTGIILGTASYMSPEQAKGKRVDKRTDIWAFGCVLLEMLTGKPVFLGEATTDTLAAVIRDEPDWSQLPETTPKRIERLLKRCLRKDPTLRLRDMGDARIEIMEVLGESLDDVAMTDTTVVSAHKNRRRTFQAALAGLVAGVIVSGLAFWAISSLVLSRRLTTQPVRRFTINLTDSEPLALTKFVPLAIGRQAIAVSPDGSNLVYVVNHNGVAQLCLRPLNQFETKLIGGTEGAYNPFFSPDGNWVGFFADNKLKKVSLAGGEPVTLCEARNPVGADWGPNDIIFFGDQEGGTLTRVSSSGGTPQAIPIGGIQAPDVEVLPDGKWLLYSTGQTSNPDYHEIRAVSVETGKGSVLIQGGSNPRYLPSGHLVFTRAANLMAAPFDLETRTVTGPAVAVMEGVKSEMYGNSQFSFSNNGTLAYVAGAAGWIGKPVWVDRQGKISQIPLSTQCYGTFKLSPDGKRLAIQVASATDDIWIYEFERGTFLRLTLNGSNIGPVWSPDGKYIVFASFRDGKHGLFQKAADGSGTEERLTTTSPDTFQSAESWSADGKALVYGEWSATDQGDIWILPLEGERKPQPFLRTPFSEFFSSFSPDGHWIVYTSDESGRYEVYVRPYPGPGGKYQVSNEGGEEPVWSLNGQELFYRNGEKWMVASVDTKSDFHSQTPRLLFENNFLNVPGLSHYPSSDGQRQVMIQPIGQDANPKQINLVLNWFEELTQRVPTGKL